MTCGSKKHIEEALAKIRVKEIEDSKEEKEVKSRLRRKERRKIATT
jgi:hypothetical protein